MRIQTIHLGDERRIKQVSQNKRQGQSEQVHNENIIASFYRLHTINVVSTSVSGVCVNTD